MPSDAADYLPLSSDETHRAHANLDQQWAAGWARLVDFCWQQADRLFDEPNDEGGDSADP